MLLDYFEDQVDQQRLVTMREAEDKLAEFIKFNNRPVLRGLGSVKRKSAIAHAEREYDRYSEKRLCGIREFSREVGAAGCPALWPGMTDVM